MASRRSRLEPMIIYATEAAANSAELIDNSFDQIRRTLQMSFWHHGDFWISTGIGIAGLGFTIWAVLEAKGAKRAAIEAGRTVKMQTVAIELMEISQKLD